VSSLLTSATVGASVTGYPTDGDTTKDSGTYDWSTSLELTSVTDPSGLALTTTYTYDSDGNLLSTTGPDKNSTTQTVTTYWSATGSGICQGRPEWAGLTCRVAPGAAITGGGSNPSELVTKAYTYDRFGEPDTLTETANGATRATTYTRDAAGRVTKKAITGGKERTPPTRRIPTTRPPACSPPRQVTPRRSPTPTTASAARSPTPTAPATRRPRRTTA